MKPTKLTSEIKTIIDAWFGDFGREGQKAAYPKMVGMKLIKKNGKFRFDIDIPEEIDDYLATRQAGNAEVAEKDWDDVKSYFTIVSNN